ncbi:DNA-binding response regulator [Microcoleus sp. A2-C5]|uniref:helix-turn-helix transcriptional regulator n=1 Tax=unclassified Microcoleus TaxID=2642155 RepID=UPI002FD54808
MPNVCNNTLPRANIQLTNVSKFGYANVSHISPHPTMASKEDLFTEAAQHWDLERLYQAFAEAKRQISPRSRRGLTDTEKLYLRGLLSGCSPAEIAKKMFQTPKSAEVYLCKTLYQYVKKLADLPNEPVGNWRNVCDRLQEAGFKVQSSAQFKVNNSLPTEALVKIVNIGWLEQSTISMDINIQLTFPSTSETPKKEDLDKND